MLHTCFGFQSTCLIRDSVWQQASLMVIPPSHPFPRAAQLTVRANAYSASASACCNERGNINLVFLFHKHRSSCLRTPNEDENNFLPACTTQVTNIRAQAIQPQLIPRAPGAAPASQHNTRQCKHPAELKHGSRRSKIYTVNVVKLFQIAICCLSNFRLSPCLLLPMKY